MIGISCPCPSDCENPELPAVNFSDCPEAFAEELSQISEVLVSVEDPENPGQPLYAPTDPSSAADWIAAFADTGAGIRRLIGIGNIPRPESNVRDISKRRKKAGLKTYTLNFNIDEVTQENYDFIRTLSCGAKLVIWYATLGGYVYGGATGFTVNVVASDPVWEEDQNAYVRLELVLEWQSKCAPTRAAYPLADDAIAPGPGGE